MKWIPLPTRRKWGAMYGLPWLDFRGVVSRVELRPVIRLAP